MKKSKNIFHNSFLYSFLGIIISLLLASWVWTNSYYLSQTRLLVSKNWYAVKSEMISSNMMGATASSFSRSIIAADQINLRALYGANEINYQHDFQLSSLAFDFIIPINAYLDVIFNIEEKEYSGIRLSKSYIYPSIYFRAKKSGEFLETRKLDLDLSNLGRSRGEIKEKGEGIVLFLNGKEAALLNDAPFKWGKFGFKSGVRGAFVSNIVARDVSDFPIDTRFRDLSKYPTHYMIHLLVIAIFASAIGSFITLIRKKDLTKNILKASSFILFLGTLWFSFDYLYFSRVDTDWDTVKKSTVQFVPVNYDLEVPRFHLFKKWNEALGGNPVDLKSFGDKFGFISGGTICYYCFNDKCGENSLKDKIEPKKLPTIKIGLIGASFTSGSGALQPEDSFFAVSHKKIYEKFKDKYNIESFNLSINPFSYITDFAITEKKLREEKFDFLILTKNTDFFIEPSQDEGFSKMVHLAYELNIRPIYLSMQRNPEAMNRYNDSAILNLLDANFIFDKHKEEDAQKITDRLVQGSGLVILNPNYAISQLELLRKGNMWWDKSHLTTYGYDVYGKWLAKEMITLISDKN